MRTRKSRLISLAILLVAGLTNVTFAQTSLNSRELPASLLRKMKPRTGLGAAKTRGISLAAPTSGLSGVDSVVNWSDQFTAPGFDLDGNPQSVWPYTMVGAPPESGRQTFINSPIVPVTLDLLGPDGSVAFTSRPGGDDREWSSKFTHIPAVYLYLGNWAVQRPDDARPVLGPHSPPRL